MAAPLFRGQSSASEAPELLNGRVWHGPPVGQLAGQMQQPFPVVGMGQHGLVPEGDPFLAWSGDRGVANPGFPQGTATVVPRRNGGQLHSIPGQSPADSSMDSSLGGAAAGNRASRPLSTRDVQSASANPQSYTVVQELGKGGSGKAFLVRGKTDGLFHVAKQIVCIGDRYSAAKASYALHETRLLFVLRHPHVVELRDFYPKSSNYFIVMEFCEQGDLARHIEHAIMQGRALFSVERVYSWWYQILDAVDFCHNKGVIHRDLKPRNVFLDRNLDVKIGDFGVAALVSFPPAVEIVGTATYHAPEVRSALNYSARSDIWAVGCIMWDAMTLRPAGGEPLSLQALNLQLIDAYGPPARELLVSHLQADRDHRGSASALKAAMLELLAGATRQAVVLRAQSSDAAARAAQQSDTEFMTPRRAPVHAAFVESLQAPQAHVSAFARGSHGQPRRGVETADLPTSASHDAGGEEVAGAPAAPLSADAGNPKAHEGIGIGLVDTGDSSGGLGIVLEAGQGGELGAWKVRALVRGSPAARCGALVPGEYLWEIDDKVIFGMPPNLLPGMFAGRSGAEVLLGLKKGLGLPIRHVLLRRDGASPAPEPDAVSAEAERPATTAGADEGPAEEVLVPTAESPGGEQSVDEDAVPSAVPTGGEQSADSGSSEGAEGAEGAPASPSNSQSTHAQGTLVAEQEQGGAIAFPQKSPLLASHALSPAMQGQTGSPPPAIADAAEKPEDAAGQPLGVNGSASLGSMQEVEQRQTTEVQLRRLQLGESHADAEVEVTSTRPLASEGRMIIAGDGEYLGELVDGRPSGRGTATWPNQGHTYVGEWFAGVMHGQGTATYLNGDRYDGEWLAGKRSGLGRYSHGSGDVYEGLWSNERKHGLGVDTFADRRGYRGEFKDNKFSGAGAYFTVDGALYQGEWLHGKAHGAGVSTSSPGGTPSLVRYQNGTLVRSEPYDPAAHEDLRTRVEELALAAIGVAVLTRRAAAAIQGAEIPPPMPGLEETETRALREAGAQIAGASILSKALLVLTGLHTAVQEDSTLEVVAAEGHALAAKEVICAVAGRSCAWFKSLSSDQVYQHIEAANPRGDSLVLAVRPAGAEPWAPHREARVRYRAPGVA